MPEFHGANDIRAFGEHLLSLDVRDIVEIDINGETNQVKAEQIDGGAALQHEPVAQGEMLVELGKEFTKTKNLFQVVGWEAGCIGDGL